MKINQKQKELIKIYIVLFIVIFFAMNWESLSWIFNYRAVTGLTHDFFNPYPENALVQNNQHIANPVTQQTPTQKTYPYSAKANSLEIPSIGLVTPLVIGQSTNIAILTKDLDNGVVYYPGSVLPTQPGQIVVLGHSAPPNWPNIKHDWVFTKLNDLAIGNEVILYFNNTEYKYRVINKKIVKAGEEVTPSVSTVNRNILTLVSCWPPGKNYQRIAVETELITQ